MPIILPPPPKERLLPKNIEEYFLDEIGKRSHLNKIEYEKHDYTHAMDMLRRREQIACLDAILAKERQKHEEKQTEFRKRWIAAAQQMKQTDESIVNLDERYQESLEDKNRQLQIAARQDELRLAKEREIRRLKKEKMILKEIREQTSERLVQFKPVEKYLERVRDHSQGEFRSIRELLDRFNLLKDTRDNLVARDEKINELIRRRQNLLDGILAVKENESILLNNYIFELTEELDKLGSKEEQLEEQLTSIKTTAGNRAMNLSKVRMATYNLYRQACKMMERLPNIPPIDTVRQLNYIQGSLIEINKLRRQLQHIMNVAVKRYKKTQMEKDKAAKLEQLRQRHALKMGPSRNIATLFGLKDGDAIQLEDKPSNPQFTRSGKMRPIIAVGGTLLPGMAVRGRGKDQMDLEKEGEGVKGRSTLNLPKQKFGIENLFHGNLATKHLRVGPSKSHPVFSRRHTLKSKHHKHLTGHARSKSPIAGSILRHTNSIKR